MSRRAGARYGTLARSMSAQDTTGPARYQPPSRKFPRAASRPGPTSSRPGRRPPRAWPWPSRRLPWRPSRATGLGAPSTRSLASLRPRLVSSRTTLMTWIFLSPAAMRMTSNSSCSSAASAAGAAAAATGGRDRDRRGRGDAELLFERLEELVQLEHGHVLEDLEQVLFAHRCHQFASPVVSSVSVAASASRCFGRLGFGARLRGLGLGPRLRPRLRRLGRGVLGAAAPRVRARLFGRHRVDVAP